MRLFIKINVPEYFGVNYRATLCVACALKQTNMLNNLGLLCIVIFMDEKLGLRAGSCLSSGTYHSNYMVCATVH